MKKLFILILILSGLSAKAQGLDVGVKQIISSTVDFSEFRMSKEQGTGKLSAYASFIQLDEKGNTINTFSYRKEGAAFDTLWNNFNSISYLFYLLNLKDSTGNLIHIPKAVEDGFHN